MSLVVPTTFRDQNSSLDSGTSKLRANPQCQDVLSEGGPRSRRNVALIAKEATQEEVSVYQISEARPADEGIIGSGDALETVICEGDVEI